MHAMTNWEVNSIVQDVHPSAIGIVPGWFFEIFWKVQEQFMRPKPGFVLHGRTIRHPITQIVVSATGLSDKVDLHQGRECSRSKWSPEWIVIEIDTGDSIGSQIENTDANQPVSVEKSQFRSEIGRAAGKRFKIIIFSSRPMRPTSSGMHIFVIRIEQIEMCIRNVDRMHFVANVRILSQYFSLAFRRVKLSNRNSQTSTFRAGFTHRPKENSPLFSPTSLQERFEYLCFKRRI